MKTLVRPREAVMVLQWALSSRTLARMADKGSLSTHKTPGGERRYLLSEIEQIKKDMGI